MGRVIGHPARVHAAVKLDGLRVTVHAMVASILKKLSMPRCRGWKELLVAVPAEPAQAPLGLTAQPELAVEQSK